MGTRDKTSADRRFPHHLASPCIPCRRHGQPHIRSIEIRNGTNITGDLFPGVTPEAGEEVGDEVCGGFVVWEARQTSIEFGLVSEGFWLEEELITPSDAKIMGGRYR
jgi:hypothetical protein